MSNTKKYIDLVSTYRDRNVYPNPSDFVVPFNQAQSSTAITSKDPIAYAFPYFTNIPGNVALTGTFGGTGGTPSMPLLSTASTGVFNNFYKGLIIYDNTIGQSTRITAYDNINRFATLQTTYGTTWSSSDVFSIPNPTTGANIFIAGGSNTDNAYNGSVIEDTVSGEYRTIIAYTGMSSIATVNSGFTDPWNIRSAIYNIRFEKPTVQGSGAGGLTVASSSSTGITFNANSQLNTSSNFYNGYYVVDMGLTGVNPYITRLITSYDPNGPTVGVSPNMTTLPVANEKIDIIQFTRDNMNPMLYSGSTVSQENEVNYEIELVSLELPNLTLSNGAGGQIAYYPFVLVSLSNVSTNFSTNNTNVLYSNNPYARKCLFKVPIDDVSLPSTSQFIKLSGNGATQTIKFKPNDNLHFSVYLPNGDLFLTKTDNFSPLPPNPTIQISALFGIKRVSI